MLGELKEVVKKMKSAEYACVDYSNISQSPSFANLLTKQQEKENTMQTLNIVAHADQSERYPTDQRQRDYLISRLHDILNTKTQELRNTFGIGELPHPRTPTEMVELIKAGKYEFKREDDLEEFDYASDFYYSPWRFITWKDPTVKKDQAGYEKAKKALDKLYQDTRDEIVVLDTEKGLAAIRQFETTSAN